MSEYKWVSIVLGNSIQVNARKIVRQASEQVLETEC